eukprot:CAMPEP_0194213568 /NCGR_PEP_ID=MMETSP0156-20130528/14259_1 /TAXON_ID=33649 /ORGANISM="Thalassionema nitzschioides, Strain L26-B" /LENGTH=396 /DNA_ID=CAMNT_0038941625 /DNA_START=86 /DNA_END=1273 /DNA_ORIENTATION=+
MQNSKQATTTLLLVSLLSLGCVLKFATVKKKFEDHLKPIDFDDSIAVESQKSTVSNSQEVPTNSDLEKRTINTTTVFDNYRSLLPDIHFPPVNYSDLQRAVICASITSEEKYVEEWLDYHLALGFSDIYISDNSPNHTLHPFNGTRANRVHVFKTSNQKSTILGQNLTGDPSWQFAQNTDCLEYLKFKQSNPPRWVAFFDVDEFLVFYNYTSVVEFLQDYVPDGAIQINWRHFGTSHHSKFLDFPVTLRFQHRVSVTNPGTKMIASLNDLKGMKVHTGNIFQWKKAGMGSRVFGGGGVWSSCCSSNTTEDLPVALYHYSTKSLEEIKKRYWCQEGTGACVKLKGRPVFEGRLFDKTAWETMTRMLPKYKLLEVPYQQALKSIYSNQTKNYQEAHDA